MGEQIKLVVNDVISNVKSYASTNILFITFFLTSVINAFLLRAFTVGNVFELKPLIADIAIVIIIGAFGYFIKPKHQFKYFFSFSIYFTVICFINSVYYNNYVSFVSFSLLATSLQAIGVADAVGSIIELKDFIFFFALIIMLIVNGSLKKRDYYKKVEKIEKGRVRAFYTLVVGIILTSFFISSLSALEIGRFAKQWNREFIATKFGIYMYQFNDLVASLKPQISPLFSFDKNAKLYRDFYEEHTKEKEINKYTDLYKGKNIIMIHAESIQTFATDMTFNGRELTPNINRLKNNGIYFSDFYAQDSVGTSSDTEFTVLTSLMPASSGTVSVDYWDRKYETIPWLLKDKGYYSFSMHGNNGTFWNRNLIHERYGYDNFFYYTKDYVIDETVGLGLSDKSFFRQSIPYIKDISEKNTNFFATMIMLSNHTPFDDLELFDDYTVDYKYIGVNPETNEPVEMTNSYLEDTVLGNYLKSVHYADQAIGEFLDGLEEEGLLDNTVVVLYGDHDAKLKRKEFERLYNYDPKTDVLLTNKDEGYFAMDDYMYELNRKVPLIIWTKDGVKLKSDEPMGMYDVMPTLGNLFGFETKYALGNDMFSLKEDNLVVFPNGDWLTRKMYYNYQKEEYFIIDKESTISSEYISENTKKAVSYIDVSNAIIVYDMIEKVPLGEEKKDNNEE